MTAMEAGLQAADKYKKRQSYDLIRVVVLTALSLETQMIRNSERLEILMEALQYRRKNTIIRAFS